MRYVNWPPGVRNQQGRTSRAIPAGPVRAIESANADKPKKRVFLQFGINPPFTVEKSRFKTRYSKFVAEKTSLRQPGSLAAS